MGAAGARLEGRNLKDHIMSSNASRFARPVILDSETAKDTSNRVVAEGHFGKIFEKVVKKYCGPDSLTGKSECRRLILDRYLISIYFL